MTTSETITDDQALSFQNSRVLPFPVALVFRAYAEPEHLARWWGPKDFRNTFETFEFRPDGEWTFVMHGPDGTDYQNFNRFLVIDPEKKIVLKHDCPPHFVATFDFNALSATETEITFTMAFETAELCASIRAYAEPKNEENFDRLHTELTRMAAGSATAG
ncbi:MAG: SRPBCC domain-containing protein [Candidatus Melainabacteria bacterium]